MPKHAAPPITIDNFTILDLCRNTIDLRILESLYIFEDGPVINNMQNAHPLSVLCRSERYDCLVCVICFYNVVMLGGMSNCV